MQITNSGRKTIGGMGVLAIVAAAALIAVVAYDIGYQVASMRPASSTADTSAKWLREGMAIYSASASATDTQK